MLIHDNPFENVGHIEIPPEKLFSVQIMHPSLRRREEPSLAGKELGVITDGGIYDIINVYSEWGQLEDGSWIKLSFTKKIK